MKVDDKSTLYDAVIKNLEKFRENMLSMGNPRDGTNTMN